MEAHRRVVRRPNVDLAGEDRDRRGERGGEVVVESRREAVPPCPRRNRNPVDVTEIGVTRAEPSVVRTLVGGPRPQADQEPGQTMLVAGDPEVTCMRGKPRDPVCIDAADMRCLRLVQRPDVPQVGVDDVANDPVHEVSVGLCRHRRKAYNWPTAALDSIDATRSDRHYSLHRSPPFGNRDSLRDSVMCLLQGILTHVQID